jgi:molybdenum-dependent DNA-binding transcriptional regulator ModE
MIGELSPKMIKLLGHIHDKGFVTKETRPFFTTFRYYNYLWMIRDMGLVQSNGCNENNRQKKWVLTEMGEKVVELYKKIDEELNKGGVENG